LEKVIHMGSASAQGGFRRVLLVQGMARLCLSRLSEKMSLTLRAGFLFAAPPLTVLVEPRLGWLDFAHERFFTPA
jgi:hypothetical protein